MASEGLSVIIPAYNAADWLSPTIERITTAIQKADIENVEIVIVNDGSSDNTSDVAHQLSASSLTKIVCIDQKNEGRFVARRTGVETAKFDTVLFVDTRVWIDEEAIKFVLDQRRSHPDRAIWNGHVNVHKEGNIIARFGDAITFVGWRRYFAHPKLTHYGLRDFDHYPKGTGCFFAPKDVIADAIRWFESVSTDLRHSSDDTLLIRHIAEHQDIWLSPEFSCTYFARTNLRAFVKHSYNRGRFFVDGFMRPGTRFFWPLVLFLIITFGCLLLLIIVPKFSLLLIPGLFLLWIAELVAALMLRVPRQDAFALFVLSPLFALVYGLGIWRATLGRLAK